MRAMLLAAGLGTRLEGLGLGVPKALVPIDGEPLLARQLRYLAAQGVDHVIVNAHHRSEQIERFAAGYRGPVQLSVIVEQTLLGTAGGVRNALPFLGEDPFVVLYGDVLTDASLGRLTDLHGSTRAVATLAVYAAGDTEGKGVVETTSDGLARAFVEKAGVGPGLVNAGLYLLEPCFVHSLPAGRFLDFGYDVFPAAIACGERVAVHVLDGPVVDVGTPEALALVRSPPARGA